MSTANFEFKLAPLETFFPSSQTEQLRQKVAAAPYTFLDKLHPNPNESQPFVEYVDERIWKSRITFHADSSYPILLRQRKAAEGRAFADLEALCEAEFQRRFPNHKQITGIKAFFKDLFPNLARMILGAENFYKELTQKEIKALKIQIAYSSCNRQDLRCSPKIEDSILRQELNVTSDDALQTDHVFSKNSPLNGQSFFQDGKRVDLSQAIAGSNDRLVENAGNLRVVRAKNGKSICYTGRPDSDKKALEQASFLFFNELKSHKKGITQSTDSRGNVIYQMDYLASSLLEDSWLFRLDLFPFPERKYLEEEKKAFKKLRENGPVTIEDPNYPGKKYSVQFNPILFSNPIKSERFQKWLPPFLTGLSHSQEVSEQGYKDLDPIVSKKMTHLSSQLALCPNGIKREELEQKIGRAESALAALKHHSLSPFLRSEQEFLLRDYLCKALDLPIIYHCKSSTDRTSITIALSSSLTQWLELQLPLPENLWEICEDYRFKELFAMNWTAGHQITRYARGGKGTVCRKTLDEKNLGLALCRGICQIPSLPYLLPERYLTDFPTSEKISAIAKYFLLLIPLTLFLYIPLFFITSMRHLAWAATLGKNPHWIGPGNFILPALPFTLFCNFLSILPQKILNEHSPQVGARHLLKGKK